MKRIVVWMLVLLVFAGLRLLVVPMGTASVFADTTVYILRPQCTPHGVPMSRQPTYAERPAAYPLILSICGVSNVEDRSALQRVVFLQYLASCLSFTLLAVVLSDCWMPSRSGRPLACVVAGLFSLSWYSGPWDGLILTESFNVSMTMMLLCALLKTFTRVTVSSTVTVLILVYCQVHLRDSNIAVPLCCLVPICLHVLFKWTSLAFVQRICSVVCIGGLVALATTSYHGVVRSGCADATLTNVLSRHILANPEYGSVFVKDYGLPKQAERFVGRLYSEGWMGDPDYMSWLSLNGQAAYRQFLLSHRRYVINRALDAVEARAGESVSASLTNYFRSWGSPVVPERFVRRSEAVSSLLVYPFAKLYSAGGTCAVWLSYLGAVIFTAYVAYRRRLIAPILAILFIILMITNQSMITSFGDATEDARHAMLGNGLMLLSFWLCLGTIVDRLFSRLTSVFSSPPHLPIL